MKPTSFLISVALACVLTLAACSSTPTTTDTATQTQLVVPVWPAAPAPTRVKFLRDIRSGQDWGIEKSWFRRWWDTLLGSGNERFVRPAAVAQWGRVLYLADPGAPALWLLDAENNTLTKVQRVGDTALQSPVALALRPDGAVYLADSALKKVFLLDRAGKLISSVSNFERPAGLAYDTQRQRLYVADSASQKVVVVAADGSVVQRWGSAGKGDGEFNYPTHLALDKAGTLLVSDALNFRVQAFDPDGRFLWKFGRHGDASGDLSSPKGLGVDRDGHVLLVDALFDVVQIFDRAGRLLLAVGDHGTAPGQFWLPAGLFVNAQNEFFVADAYNQRVQVFQVIGDSDVKETQ